MCIRDRLNAFAAEVTRVAREVGTEGKLGGQAQVPGVAGTWKDLTDNVNVMAANLTEQVRGIVKVVTAVANGELTQKLTVNAKGEVAALAETINNMTDTLATFADQVTTVAREVGVEGRLGGQANVPGAAGTWKDLTGNVNLLADNLTNQVRAIAEVATAVTKGDLTRSIQVEASGEVAELKDNINTMIDNLRLTTDRNTEQDWLKTNLARFTGMLQGQRDLATVGRMLLSELAPLVSAQQGVIYQMGGEESADVYKRQDVIHIVDHCQAACHLVVPVEGQRKNMNTVFVETTKRALRAILLDSASHVTGSCSQYRLQFGGDRNQLAVQIVDRNPKQVFAVSESLHGSL